MSPEEFHRYLRQENQRYKVLGQMREARAADDQVSSNNPVETGHYIVGDVVVETTVHPLSEG